MDSRDLTAPALVLFRSDLRLADNAALTAAAQSGRPVIPVFVLDEMSPSVRPIGGARRWWLHHSLAALQDGLRKAGSPLVLRRGAMGDAVLALARQTGAAAVFWNRRYQQAEREADAAMKIRLKADGIEAASHAGFLLHEPWEPKTAAGQPFRVFTPFYRALQALPAPGQPLPRTGRLRPPLVAPESDSLDSWNLLPKRPDWAAGLRAAWKPGEAAAHAQFHTFLKGPLAGYPEARDFPGMDGTSRLSPYLAHGEISPRQVFHALAGNASEAAAKFLRQIGWREFSWHLLFHNPGLETRNFNPAFDNFAWKADSKGLNAWQKGRTGYPLVDAGMRQLWETGWMHNRVRMAAASFLTKHLLIDWRLGEDWFWDTLVDADAANNAAGWQWVAGSGADAAPYYRIFNPTLQGERFDAQGQFVRRFVPELAGLPDAGIQQPEKTSPANLQAAGVELGNNYPMPIIEHGFARDRALAAYAGLKGELPE